MHRDSWDIMRRGDAEKALAQMREDFDAEWNRDCGMPTCLSETMELGVACLWLRDYESARDIFRKFNERFPRHAHDTYDMGGVAKWCLGESQHAVEQWHEGLGSAYGDTAGLAIMPSLLLFFASVVRPETFARREAEKLLEKKAADSRSREWPIVQFVLGQIDEETLRRHCDDGTPAYKDARGKDPREEQRLLKERQADFWSGVLALAAGDGATYQARMREAGQLDWSDFDANKDLFLSTVWTPEFFLARHESTKDV